MAKKENATQVGKDDGNAFVPKDILTFTRITAFETCPMLDYYQYGVGGRGVEPTIPYLPFIEGDFGHYAVAMFYKTKRMLRANLMKRQVKVLSEIRDNQMVTAEMEGDIRVSLAMLTGAASGYRDKYIEDFEKYEVLFVEQPFAFRLGEFQVQGKIDRGLQDKKTGELMSWETKWVGGLTQGAYAALPMSLQDLIYCEGFKAITGQYPTLRCRDYIQKSRLRLKTDKGGGNESFLQYETRVQQQYVEEKDKMFWRPPPQIVLPTTIENVKDNVLRLMENRARVMDNPYMSFSCTGMFGNPCSMVPACIAKLQGHDDGWNAPECRGMYRMKKDLHPELKKEKDEED